MLSDWRALTETPGMTAGTPDAIDRLIDMYSEPDFEPVGPECIMCGEVCPRHDSGFIFDAGHDEYYIALGIEWGERVGGVHPLDIIVPIHNDCWENAQWGEAKKQYHIALREWYKSQNEEE